MSRLTSTTLPDDLDTNPFSDLADDEIEVNHVKELPEDADVLEPVKRAKNEREESDDDHAGDEEDLDNPLVQAAVARERARLRQREDAWLKEQEAADNALLNSEKQKLKAQQDAFKVSIDAVDVRIKTAREALKLARQDNDYNAMTDIEGQIREMENLRTQIEHNARQLPQESQLDNAFQEHINKRRQRIASERESDGGDGEGVKPLNGKAERWAEANRSWFGKNKDAMDALAKIDAAMATEGYNPKSDEYFTELTRRMAKASPGVSIRDLTGRGGSATRGRPNSDRAPVAGARSAQPAVGGGDPSRKIRVTLDASDRAMMKKLGLDPSNEKHTARFAKERGMRLAQEARDR